MRYIFIIAMVLISTLYSNPIDNAYSWISQEYKDFRTYPRVNKAQLLLKKGEKEEAKTLLEKSLEIDSENRNAINLLLKICIEEKDTLCIKKYSKKAKGVGVGYFYKKRAEEEKEKGEYLKAIEFSKKALEHKLKEKDRYFIKLILFESYLKSNQYKKADELIHKNRAITYELFNWSKISDNIKETSYAYSLAKELPNKKEYIKWKIELLLKSKRYSEASKELELLNKIEPSDENKKKLIYLYSLTSQDKRVIKDYKEKLKKGCDKYALESLLNYYKNNKKRKISLLENQYPYNCLNKKRRIELSLQLINYLKRTKPKKSKQIARELSAKVEKERDLINIYQTSGQKDKLVNIYKEKLNKSCDSYALYFLLDYYKNNKKAKKNILEKAYPYSCLPADKQTNLSLELINILDKKDSTKTKLILNNLDKNNIPKKNYLYLSNLESSLKNYEKAIEYATAYLQINPNSSEAIKNIGYAYFKLDKKNSALHYLIEASKLDSNDYELLKNIGYLSMDLEKYDKASYYWNLYLSKKRDTQIQLELASLYYYKLNQPKRADEVLNRYKISSKKYNSDYYLLKAKLLYKEQKCKESLKYYKKALKIKKSKYVRYEQIHLLQQCKEDDKALKLMQGFVNDYPDNLQYQKELAYMYDKKKRYKEAIKNFKQIKAKEPQKVENYTTLAYLYKKNGQKKEAINTFKEAIDRSKNMNQYQRKYIKREITNESKAFHFYLVQSARLNSYKQGGKLSPVNSASYNGFGTLQLSYQPKFLPKRTTIYANIIHSHKKAKKSIQPSIGIRYKPIKDKEVYLSAEQLIKGGKESRSDTLLRASLGISGNPNSSKHEELYLEGAYFTKANSTVLYGNYEFGTSYKVSPRVKVTPYITTGATYNNDNDLKKSVTKMDVGVGVGVDILSDESDYEIEKYRNRLKLEARRKYAGNSKDKEALRLQWEFFY
ncbi:TPR domain protein, putative component of TonB system [hydrothermal vent metagenome]|uniref:TPR domain protein, putative component of TonB system n=1 Tax=hydrothermal vent metagenome TaxID=652676 RepID=A0A1W1C0Y6_9ZZZZ